MNPFAFRNRKAHSAVVVDTTVRMEGGLILSEHALAHGLEEKRRHAVAAGGEVLRAIASELAVGNRSRLQASWQQLESLFDVVQLTDECLRLLENHVEPQEPVARPRELAVSEYLVSSWFLAECAEYLLSNPEGHERLHLVTGIKIREGQRTLDRMTRVGIAEQSATHAIANQHDLQRLLIECSERWGHSLHGLFHSHPGRGALASRPSGLDLTTHERYERAYPLVGAIFERTGFVRFFSHRPFTVTLYGKGVEQYEAHLFKIQHLRPVSDDTPARGDGQRAAGDPPARAGAPVQTGRADLR